MISDKKLELVLGPGPSLRERGDAYWRGAARLAGAKILSKVSTAGLDAYLLSESSLFVADRRLTLITCGATDIRPAARKLMDGEDVRGFVYERPGFRLEGGRPPRTLKGLWLGARVSRLFASRGDGPAAARALLKGWTVDEHFFRPVGYSLNAVKGGRYCALHVTPEGRGAYASLETNAGPAPLRAFERLFSPSTPSAGRASRAGRSASRRRSGS